MSLSRELLWIDLSQYLSSDFERRSMIKKQVNFNFAANSYCFDPHFEIWKINLFVQKQSLNMLKTEVWVCCYFEKSYIETIYTV